MSVPNVMALDITMASVSAAWTRTGARSAVVQALASMSC